MVPGKRVVINHQAGNKAFFFTIAVGHGVVYRLAAPGAVEKIHAIAQVPEQRQLKTPQRGLRRAAGPGERLNAVQVVEKEFGETCFVLQHAGDKLVNVETAVEGDAAERQRQRNGFRAAQGFDFAAPAEANQQGGKGL